MIFRKLIMITSISRIWIWLRSRSSNDMHLKHNRVQIWIAHRLQVAWANFHKHNKALTNRDISLRLRLRLVHTVVFFFELLNVFCISFIYRLFRSIDVVQRRMLRCIVGWIQIPDEDWEVTMKRMRHKVSRATKLILLSPCSYYMDDRQWMFVWRIEIADAGIWPRAIVDWEPFI